MKISKKSKEVRKVLKEKGVIWPKRIQVNFATCDGRIVKIDATKGTEYYERKDVLKIIRILKNKSEDSRK